MAHGSEYLGSGDGLRGSDADAGGRTVPRESPGNPGGAVFKLCTFKL